MKIIALSFKDDSFRTFNWNVLPSKTNGDSITINNETISRTLISPISYNNVNSMYVKAYSSSSSTLTISLYSSSNTLITSYSQALSPISNVYSFAYNFATNIQKISLNTSGSATIDFIAFSRNVSGGEDFIEGGGDSLVITLNKKTVKLTVPNAADVIQQLGIYSYEYTFNLPMLPISFYQTLENWLSNSIPILILSDTIQATGYLTEVSYYTEAGYVDGNTILYNITIKFIKSDQDVL